MSKINSVHTVLKTEICEDAHDAIKRGYFYREPVYKPIQIEKAVVIKNGTTAGNSTVDFVLVDESGQKFVFMITGTLIKTLAGIA